MRNQMHSPRLPGCRNSVTGSGCSHMSLETYPTSRIKQKEKPGKWIGNSSHVQWPIYYSLWQASHSSVYQQTCREEEHPWSATMLPPFRFHSSVIFLFSLNVSSLWPGVSVGILLQCLSSGLKQRKFNMLLLHLVLNLILPATRSFVTLWKRVLNWVC